MAEHDWRDLLDDPHIETVINRALRAGRDRYWRRNDALLYDDLTSWIWDRAVDIALWFDVTRFTDVTNPRDLWHAVLYTQLVKSIRRGDHLEHALGNHGSDQDLAMRAQKSIQAEEERLGDAAWSHALFRHAITQADPLGVVLRLEHLERLARKAHNAARHGLHNPTEHDGLCVEPMCLRPVLPNAPQWGRCSVHYAKARELWIVGTCTVDGCTGPAKARGLCPTHYAQERRTDTTTPRCSMPDCERPARTRGLCESHYSIAHQNGTHTQYTAPVKAPKQCGVPGCGKPTKARGMCNAHYLADRKARRR